MKNRFAYLQQLVYPPSPYIIFVCIYVSVCAYVCGCVCVCVWACVCVCVHARKCVRMINNLETHTKIEEPIYIFMFTI